MAAERDGAGDGDGGEGGSGEGGGGEGGGETETEKQHAVALDAGLGGKRLYKCGVLFLPLSVYGIEFRCRERISGCRESAMAFYLLCQGVR